MKKNILPFVIAIVAVGIALSGFLIRVGIVCECGQVPCPKEVERRLSAYNGKSLYSAKRGIKKELKSDFLVSTYLVQFKLPAVLKVDMVIKKAVYAVKSAENGSIGLVDAAGTVLEHTDQANLPTVVAAGSLPNPGSRVDDKIYLALKLTGGVYKMYKTGNAVIEGDTLTVELPGPIRVIFPLTGKDSDFLLGSLRLIYTNIKNGEYGNRFSEIDLRYKNPVLR